MSQTAAQKRYGDRRTMAARRARVGRSKLWSVPLLGSEPEPKVHVWIPDTQIEPGLTTVHTEWAGQYVVDQFEGHDLTVVVGGDWYNMGSLSTYDRGTVTAEGKRIKRDMDYGDAAFEKFDKPMREKTLATGWTPRKVYLPGNHEDRITRAVEHDPKLEGLIYLEQLYPFVTEGWEPYDYLEVADIDGIAYSHYFYNPMTGKPYGGQSIDTRLKTIGRTFTMGHQQGYMYGRRESANVIHQGLVAGSFYLHDEKYLGPQGNANWRGIVVKHQVENGTYDPMFVSADYLCRRYEGMRLRTFLEKYGVER